MTDPKPENEFDSSNLRLVRCRGWCNCQFQGLAGNYHVELCNACAMEAGERAACLIYNDGELERWNPKSEIDKSNKASLMQYYLRAKRILGHVVQSEA